jgi:hypothetical protein
MTFKHRVDDAVYTVRFRKDVNQWLATKMQGSTWKPSKSLNQVLDEQLRKRMKYG